MDFIYVPEIACHCLFAHAWRLESYVVDRSVDHILDFGIMD